MVKPQNGSTEDEGSGVLQHIYPAGRKNLHLNSGRWFKLKRITDRFWLGVLSGLGGNVVKTAIEQVASRTGISKETGAKKAAGIFLKKSDINTAQGKIIGLAADNMIAALLGVTCVYWFTLMGKDKFVLKGASLGALEWAGLYGVLSRLGATAFYPTRPQDAIVAMVSHFAYGATKGTIIANLGDDRLFTPQNLIRKIREPRSLLTPQTAGEEKILARGGLRRRSQAR